MKILQVFVDFIEDIEPLSDAEVGRLFKAMLRYAADDKYKPDLKGNERFTWATAKKMINKNWAEYRRLCERNKRVAENRYDTTPADTKNTTRTFWCQEEEKEEEEYKEEYIKETLSKEREKKRFVPPSLDEVTAYCNERNNTVDPAGFIDFYTSNGWRVGKNPMKDWKAAVRSWEQRDRKEAVKQAKKKKPGRFDVLNEAIRKEMAANGSGGGNAMSFLNGKPLVELPGAGDT